MAVASAAFAKAPAPQGVGRCDLGSGGGCMRRIVYGAGFLMVLASLSTAVMAGTPGAGCGPGGLAAQLKLWESVGTSEHPHRARLCPAHRAFLSWNQIVITGEVQPTMNDV